ncbi:hypothetical protein SLS55_005065 [Diplodia seriata]|uniref:Uncharacterized protein n=1 Tax=Diplodia seriata TaxID=420778 RepID=A0ABR3CIN7_9PEZI
MSRDVHATLTYLLWSDLYLTEKPFKLFINIPETAQDQRDHNLDFEDKKIRETGATDKEDWIDMNDPTKPLEPASQIHNGKPDQWLCLFGFGRNAAEQIKALGQS